jgi:hypothetical protein
MENTGLETFEEFKDHISQKMLSDIIDIGLWAAMSPIEQDGPEWKKLQHVVKLLGTVLLELE